MCDDVEVTVRGDRIVETANACPLGRSWFLERQQNGQDLLPVCTIDGRPAPLEAGLDLAARLLTSARFPLVYGLSETTAEAQSRAAAIADWLGGTLDTATSSGHAPSILAFQSVGKVSATLGEIRHRSDLIIFWGANPIETHPRVYSRYTAMPAGMFVPAGRAGRTCVLVDVQSNRTAEEMDLFFKIKPGADFEALWTLRACVRGLSLDAEQVLEQTGVALAAWAALAARMKKAQFGAFLFGMGLMRSRGQHANCEALFALNRELNDHTRFVCRSIRARGNSTGADKVVSWRTGYPIAVDLSRGYPRYNPGEYTATESLSRGEPDAALVVASDPLSHFPEAACEHLRRIPLVSVGAQDTATRRAARVAFTTALYGIHAAGTVYRMDEVPLHVRGVTPSPYPTDVEVLTGLERRVRELQREAQTS